MLRPTIFGGVLHTYPLHKTFYHNRYPGIELSIWHNSLFYIASILLFWNVTREVLQHLVLDFTSQQRQRLSALIHKIILNSSHTRRVNLNNSLFLPPPLGNENHSYAAIFSSTRTHCLSCQNRTSALVLHHGISSSFLPFPRFSSFFVLARLLLSSFANQNHLLHKASLLVPTLSHSKRQILCRCFFLRCKYPTLITWDVLSKNSYWIPPT